MDDIGRAVDAFAHHVLVDSLGSIVLTDLQGFIFHKHLSIMKLNMFVRCSRAR
jgi:hypothetical protein